MQVSCFFPAPTSPLPPLRSCVLRQRPGLARIARFERPSAHVLATSSGGSGGSGGRPGARTLRRFGSRPDPFRRPLRPSGLLGLVLLVLAGRAEEPAGSSNEVRQEAACSALCGNSEEVAPEGPVADQTSTQRTGRKANSLLWLIPFTCLFLATDASLLGYGPMLHAAENVKH